MDGKMKKKFIILLLLITAVCFANSPFDIEKSELEIKITAALKGNAKSANELSLYYEFSHNVVDENKENMTLFWLLIAAENDTDGFYMKELSSYLISTNPKSKDRGLYWLYLSAKLGNKESKKDIKNIYSNYNFEFYDDSDFSNEINISKEALIYGALHGSGKAALQLSAYFKTMNDMIQYKYWLRIGAQNGNKECMKQYAALLRQSADEYDKIRAEFWEKKLAK